MLRSMSGVEPGRHPLLVEVLCSGPPRREIIESFLVSCAASPPPPQATGPTSASQPASPVQPAWQPSLRTSFRMWSGQDQHVASSWDVEPEGKGDEDK